MVHILVVDDDEKLNRSVCKWLNDSGFEAKGALSADDAFDAMYNSLYDLIISDIMMPETDGFEFAEKVREVNKHIPILFMSAKDDLPSKQKGFQIGIVDYMVKLIELAELEMRVRALLRRANIDMERKLKAGDLVLDADAVTAEIMAGSVFAVTAEPPRIALCVILAVPTFAGWILPYFIYKKVKSDKTKKVDPYIREKYEEIYSICEKGHSLM